jgi:hypothetical protein
MFIERVWLSFLHKFGKTSFNVIYDIWFQSHMNLKKDMKWVSAVVNVWWLSIEEDRSDKNDRLDVMSFVRRKEFSLLKEKWSNPSCGFSINVFFSWFTVSFYIFWNATNFSMFLMSLSTCRTQSSLMWS